MYYYECTPTHNIFHAETCLIFKEIDQHISMCIWRLCTSWSPQGGSIALEPCLGVWISKTGEDIQHLKFGGGQVSCYHWDVIKWNLVLVKGTHILFNLSNSYVRTESAHAHSHKNLLRHFGCQLTLAAPERVTAAVHSALHTTHR